MVQIEKDSRNNKNADVITPFVSKLWEKFMIFTLPSKNYCDVNQK
jgi:hypothetical protein